MTDKEFKRLSRAELIEIIYRLQLQIDKLTGENEALENALKDKRLRISNAGSLAEAVLEINGCLLSAQNAADQYLNEIKMIRDETEAEKKRILAKAQEEAAAIIASAQKTDNAHDSASEDISNENRQSHSDNR